jgi:uncharacterized protein YeaC (DUF1315 family)
MEEIFLQKSKSIEVMLEQLTPEMIEQIKSAIEIGKWPDGSSVKAEQLEHCMQLLILYEARTLPESARTGSKLENCHSRSELEVILELRDDKIGETG